MNSQTQFVCNLATFATHLGLITGIGLANVQAESKADTAEKVRYGDLMIPTDFALESVPLALENSFYGKGGVVIDIEQFARIGDDYVLTLEKYKYAGKSELSKILEHRESHRKKWMHPLGEIKAESEQRIPIKDHTGKTSEAVLEYLHYQFYNKSKHQYSLYTTLGKYFYHLRIEGIDFDRVTQITTTLFSSFSYEKPLPETKTGEWYEDLDLSFAIPSGGTVRRTKRFQYHISFPNRFYVINVMSPVSTTNDRLEAAAQRNHAETKKQIGKVKKDKAGKFELTEISKVEKLQVNDKLVYAFKYSGKPIGDSSYKKAHSQMGYGNFHSKVFWFVHTARDAHPDPEALPELIANIEMKRNPEEEQVEE